MKKKINTKISSLFSFFTLLFVLLLVLSLQGSLTGRAVFVLDDDVTADQIATIATLAGPGDETKMLSEVSLDTGGYVIFSGLDDGDSAIIKEREGNIYVKGNLEDAVSVIKNSDYKQLLEEHGVLEIVNGEIVEEAEKEEEVEELEDVEEEIEEEETVYTVGVPSCEQTLTGASGYDDRYGLTLSHETSCTTREEYDYNTGKHTVIAEISRGICDAQGYPAWESEICPEGYICGDNNDCVKESVSCTDSDISEKEPLVVAGEVSFTSSDGEKNTAKDYCQTVSGKEYVFEYSCGKDGTTVTKDGYLCDIGCSNGVCVMSGSSSCKDYDSGIDPSVYGGVEYFIADAAVSGTEVDYCSVDGMTLTEWYCEDGAAKSTEINCDADCEYGVCTQYDQSFFSQITTVDAFLASTQDWYYDMKIVIPSKGSTQDYLAALALVGKYGYPLVKDTAVSDYQTLHAIVVGGPSVNTISKAVIEAGASQEGVYYVYQDSTYYGTVLVVGSDDPKETRKAVKELMKR